MKIVSGLDCIGGILLQSRIDLSMIESSSGHERVMRAKTTALTMSSLWQTTMIFACVCEDDIDLSTAWPKVARFGQSRGCKADEEDVFEGNHGHKSFVTT